jgi:hypothetical protein
MPLFRKSPTAPTPLGAITGGGTLYRVSSYADATTLTLQRQEWQKQVFKVYNLEGHLYYATNYIGSAMARINLVAARRPKKDGENARPTIIEKGAIADAVKNIQSPRGGQSGFMRQVGKNVFMTGEVWLVGDVRTTADGIEVQEWDAVSVSELTTVGTSASFYRRRLPGAVPEPLAKDALTIRIWKEHPEWSELADSGVRSCLPLLEKIIVLNNAEKAVARSQLAGSGILALPQELVPPAWQNQQQNPNAMESNPLWQALAESMTAPLEDEGHPSSVVPLLLVGPADIVNKMKYEPMTRNFDSNQATNSIKLAIEQVANTLELPKEILLGTGDVTHFTAWAIREDTFQAHIQPLVEMVVTALTRTYLTQFLNRLSVTDRKKVLEEAGVDSVEDVLVWYDASQLIIRPDKADKAAALHDRIVISDSALRRENGFTDEDAPSDMEKAQRIGLKVADPNMALTGKPPAPQTPPGGPQSDENAANRGPGRPTGPATVNGPKGKAPQGANAAPPKTPSERRVTPT